MKTNILFLSIRSIITGILCLIGLQASAESVTVTEAGTLSKALPSTAKEATISGPLNGTDIKYLRQLLTEGELTSLDLSEAIIVSGGDEYYDGNTTTDNVISKYMFFECKNLTSVVLPKSVNRIHQKSFTNTGLTEIDIPNNIIGADWDAFASCANLTKATIGNGVSSLGQGVFWSSPVTDVYSKPMVPPTLAAYQFTSKPTIHVFKDALERYQSSDWAEYGSVVGDLDEYFPTERKQHQLLNTYFEDAACTQLRFAYKSMTSSEMAAAMRKDGLDEVLVEMALKIKDNKWGKYEQGFRVHEYQAYSDANYWNNRTKSYNGSHMGNPTGIYTTQGETLYVMVDDDIPANATLYISGCQGKKLISSAQSGQQLIKGLNVVQGTPNDLYYILYTANTTNGDKRISEWPSIKIHIEGGTVNGYYDIAQHNSSDYPLLLKQATHELFTVKGRHSCFNFQTETYRQEWPTAIDSSISWFDSINVWQKELLGICESVASGKRASAPYHLTGGDAFYPDFYNNPSWAIQGDSTDSGLANATTFRTCYNSYKAVVVSFNVTRDDFDEWCASHEVGHNNQKVFNLEACTEVTNNLFSNVMHYLGGRNASWGKPLSTTTNDHVNHVPFCERDIWSKTRMYYQLYLYYHQAKHNTAFYPTLFQNLREDPLVLWENGNDSHLKFVRKVCEVAQEDLTDFFTYWGFFEPYSGTPADYGNREFSITQADIDATLAEIAKYPRKNRQMLFIEDRISPLTTTGYLTAEGQNRKDNENLVGKCGDRGQYTDYIEGNGTAASYTLIEKDSLCVMNGTGGVGFIVLDKNEHLLFATNNSRFELPDSIRAIEHTIYAVEADGTLRLPTKGGDGTVTVNLTKPGTLESQLKEGNIHVTITGPINGTDIKYLRKLLNEDILTSIDLSDAQIVEGGEAYFEDYTTQNDVIGQYMFNECQHLTSIVLPKNIISIEKKAFTATGLQKIVIPDQVQSVGWDAFASCPQLTEVTIGQNVNNLGQGVFWSSPVKQVYVYPTTPPALGPYQFTSKPTIHVQPQTLADYQASAWPDYGTLVGDLEKAEGIEIISTDGKESSRIYDLLGRPVANPVQGKIYIIDGKKKMQRK